MTAVMESPGGVAAQHVEAAARYLWAGEWARPDQLPPDGDWNVWLIMSGRGWGKTRTGAEWLAYEAVRQPGTRWAIVAPTAGDVRDTCAEGVSGVLPILHRYRQVKVWNRSLGELRLINGSRIKLFSGDEPDRLRGPQHHGAWCDEVSAWRYPDSWDQLQFGLRLGTHPRVLATTTPKPTPLIKQLVGGKNTVITRGATFDNAANLSEAALAHLRERYEGTRLGSQELYGELLEDIEGALWTRALIDNARVTETHPSPLRRVVAVDPAMSHNEFSDWTGIVVASTDGHEAWVEHDYTVKASPNEWANRVAWAYHEHTCDLVVVESNQGGELLDSVLHAADINLPVKRVHATKGKHTRAEPIAALYEQGRVHHVGAHHDLETQMTEWVPGDPSPDRMDALVWALTELMLGRNPRPIQRLRT